MAGLSRAIVLEADVRGDSLDAFDSFVAAMDEHWAGPTPAGRAPSPGDVRVEPHAGGKLGAGVEGKRLELGRITLWQPGHRLEADWREPDWPAGVLTSVTVSFEPADTATHVSLEHRGFEHLGAAAESIAQRYETGWREVLDTAGRRAQDAAD